MKKQGKKAVLLREPGGVKISEKIRSIILDPLNRRMDPLAELLLYEAARAQLVKEKIAPLLNKGYTVILDRFYLATTVYQGYGRGIDRALIQRLNSEAAKGIKNIFFVVYDVPQDEAAKRMRTRRSKDRIESAGRAFHAKIRNGYIKEAGKMKNSILIKTGGKSAGQVFEETVKALGSRI